MFGSSNYSLAADCYGGISLKNAGRYDPRANLHRPMEVIASRGDWSLLRAWNGSGYYYIARNPVHGDFYVSAMDEPAARTMWRRMLDRMGVSE